MKDCFIHYEKAAVNVTVKECTKPLVKDCDLESDEEFCSTYYASECRTTNTVEEV